PQPVCQKKKIKLIRTRPHSKQRKTSGLKPPHIKKKNKISNSFVFFSFYFVKYLCDSIAKVGKFFCVIFLFFILFFYLRGIGKLLKRKRDGKKKSAKMIRKKGGVGVGGGRENEKIKVIRKKYWKIKIRRKKCWKMKKKTKCNEKEKKIKEKKKKIRNKKAILWISGNAQIRRSQTWPNIMYRTPMENIDFPVPIIFSKVVIQPTIVCVAHYSAMCVSYLKIWNKLVCVNVCAQVFAKNSGRCTSPKKKINANKQRKLVVIKMAQLYERRTTIKSRRMRAQIRNFGF
ncbi:hypothetical protein RFI_35315, partial [Reticulomyxa filosa]